MLCGLKCKHDLELCIECEYKKGNLVVGYDTWRRLGGDEMKEDEKIRMLQDFKPVNKVEPLFRRGVSNRSPNERIAQISFHVEKILEELDLNIKNEHLENTPLRVAQSYMEIFKGLFTDPPPVKVFDANGYNQMIVRKNIPFYSMCAHHFLPFFGTISIAYIPTKYMAGISKLARVAVHFSCRPQTQELLTQDIVNYLNTILKPKGCGVYITGKHLCEEMRGILKTSEMITTSLKGNFFIDNVKAEFLESVR